MIDFTSLLLFAGLFLGAILGNAAYFGDPIDLRITVPPRLVQAGFTESLAEEVFVTSATDVSVAKSIVPTPKLEIGSRPTLAHAIASPLNLDPAVVAVQGAMGIDVTTIHGAVVDNDKTPTIGILMVVSEPHEPSTEISVSRDDGDVRALLHQAARLSLERVAPYRVALTDFENALDGNDAAFTRAHNTTINALAQPWIAHRATERVMLCNLLALLDVVSGDVAAAETDFRAADVIPDGLPGSYGTIAINRAFLAVAAKQPTEARRWFAKGRQQTEDIRLPDWEGRMYVLDALIAWSEGDAPRAERLLHAASTAAPKNESPHAYLAQLATARGDKAAAAAEQAAASAVHGLEPRIPSLAQSEFWVDPVKGGLTRHK
jgi:hypothetical protein